MPYIVMGVPFSGTCIYVISTGLSRVSYDAVKYANYSVYMTLCQNIYQWLNMSLSITLMDQVSKDTFPKSMNIIDITRTLYYCTQHSWNCNYVT